MLAYDLLNKYRLTSLISDYSTTDLQRQGRLQTLVRTDSLEIIHPVQGGGRGGGVQKLYLVRTLPVS